MKERDKYLKLVEWSEEDQCCHGTEEEKVYHNLCKIVDEWIEIYKNEGLPLPEPTNKKYSGKFQLRLGNELHRAISLRALQAGDSLNNFCVKTLKHTLNSSPNPHSKE
jgi:predicted HicB family RNase H-like nuclease